MESQVTLHLLHHHSLVSADQAMVCSALEETNGYWTAPTTVEDVELKNLRPLSFAVDEFGRLSPYEFLAASTVLTESVQPDFVRDFIDRLVDRNLHKVFGLQLVRRKYNDKMVEFPCSNGNILLNEEHVNPHASSLGQYTTWSAATREGLLTIAGEIRCVTYPDGKHYQIPIKTGMGPSSAIDMLKASGVLW